MEPKIHLNLPPWVATKGGRNTCPLRSINPEHWRDRVNGLDERCRCFIDIAIFNWDGPQPRLTSPSRRSDG